jgi:hypothetical protein
VGGDLPINININKRAQCELFLIFIFLCGLHSRPSDEKKAYTMPILAMPALPA